MAPQWDLAAYSREHRLVLAVEVKTRRNATPAWAARLRRNILAHGTFPNAPYFLIAFPDHFYLWVDTVANLEAIEPAYVIDAGPILQPYFEQAGITGEQVSRQSLELIIATWLNELIYTEEVPDEFDDANRWLVDSGLYHAILGGSLTYEIMV